MKQIQFIKEKQDFWLEFEAQLAQLQGSKTKLSAQALEQFPKMYRQMCHDLALAQSRHYQAQLINRLNHLVLQGQQVLYRSQYSLLSHLSHFIVRGLPQSLRANRSYLLLSSLLFYGSGLVVFLLVQLNANAISFFIDANTLSKLESMYDPSATHFGVERLSDSDFLMFAYYISHNIGIGFQTFASGLFFAVGSAFYLLVNGLHLGATSAHMLAIGYEQSFFSFVITHGAFELNAIVLAGASGLKLGSALLFPARLPRYKALEQQAKQAFPLVIATFLLLLIAAFIEAFWSSSAEISTTLKFVVGGLCWLLVCLYLTFAGKSFGSQ